MGIKVTLSVSELVLVTSGLLQESRLMTRVAQNAFEEDEALFLESAREALKLRTRLWKDYQEWMMS